MFQKALVAVDGSQPSLKAVDTACQLMETGALKEITLLNVVHYPAPAVMGDGITMLELPVEYHQVLRDAAQQIIEEVQKHLESSTNVNSRVESGNPAEVILDVAQKDKYDLIVIGSRGLNQVQRLFMGSVSSKVVTLAHCPVLVVK